MALFKNDPIKMDSILYLVRLLNYRVSSLQSEIGAINLIKYGPDKFSKFTKEIKTLALSLESMGYLYATKMMEGDNQSLIHLEASDEMLHQVKEIKFSLEKITSDLVIFKKPYN